MQRHGWMRGEEFGGLREDSRSHISSKLECRCMASHSTQRLRKGNTAFPMFGHRQSHGWVAFFPYKCKWFTSVDSQDRFCFNLFQDAAGVRKGILLTPQVPQGSVLFIYNTAGPVIQLNDLLNVVRNDKTSDLSRYDLNHISFTSVWHAYFSLWILTKLSQHGSQVWLSPSYSKIKRKMFASATGLTK